MARGAVQAPDKRNRASRRVRRRRGRLPDRPRPGRRRGRPAERRHRLEPARVAGLAGDPRGRCTRQVAEKFGGEASIESELGGIWTRRTASLSPRPATSSRKASSGSPQSTSLRSWVIVLGTLTEKRKLAGTLSAQFC